MFFDRDISKLTAFYYMETGLYSSIKVIDEGMNTLIQERHNHSETCITVKVSLRMQEVEIYLANEGCGLTFLSKDLGHILGSNIGISFGVLLRTKGPQNQNFLTALSAYTLS